MLRSIWSAVLDLLFPTALACELCGQLLPVTSGATSVPVCDLCLSEARLITDPCAVCGRHLFGRGSVCRDCARAQRSFRLARAHVRYLGVVKELTLRAKYDADRRLLEPLLGWLEEGWNRFKGEFGHVDCVTFVPSAEKDERARGFNAAQVLADHLCACTGLSLIDVLMRERSLGPQSVRTRQERLRRQVSSFGLRAAARGHQPLAGACVLLVDDVLTTGSTVEACSRLLRAAGAASVDVLAVAH